MENVLFHHAIQQEGKIQTVSLVKFCQSSPSEGC